MKLAAIALVLVAGPLLARAAIAADAPAIIYECKDANGEVVYQDDPCTPPAPAPAAKPKAAAKLAVAKPKVASKPTVAPKPAAAALPWTAVLPAAPRLAHPPLLDPSPDARWASPQRTLQTFVGAVKAGDGALVLSCLTSSALADLGPDVEELPIHELQSAVGSFTGYVVEGDLGPYWSVRALRAGTRPKWIFLQRTGSGEWKIGAF